MLDLATGKLTQLTSGEYTESDAAWSPDGRRIVFVSNREQEPDASYRSDLWIVDAGNTDKGATLVRLTNDERSKSEPAFSPDGKSIAFLVAADGVYGAPQVAVMPATGGEAKVLTAAHDRWVNGFQFSADGEWIYFIYENLGGNQVARVRPSDGRLEQVIEGERGIGDADLAKGGAIVARVETGNRAPEIHVFSGGRERALTRINADFHERVALGAKESVSFKAPDGTEVQAFVTKPPGFVPGRRYPTVLHIHGGPVGQFGWGFDFKPQYLAAQGYVVVEPNPRGSTGRGEDFVRAIYQTWGITDYDDLIAAVDHVIALGYADPERLAVTGYSYGGYMTNVVITRTDRFKAAASGAGHSYIVANYGHDIYQKWYNWELGPPWENREKYDRLSPLLQAGKVTTPTIFLGGREDWNVPLAERRALLPVAAHEGRPDRARRLPGRAPRRLAEGVRARLPRACDGVVRQVPEVDAATAQRRGGARGAARTTGRCAPSSSAASTSSAIPARSTTCGCSVERSSARRAIPRPSRSCARPSALQAGLPAPARGPRQRPRAAGAVRGSGAVLRAGDPARAAAAARAQEARPGARRARPRP